MRSRYSAFVLERAAYLQTSWAASHRPESIEFDPATKWLGLDVRAHRVISDSTAEVEFVARQKPAHGPAVRLHERSRFVREAGRWLYVDGDQL
jgi:SEC-C motif-containing protein